MHCHIAWHTSEGFAVQFLERESEMLTTSGVLNAEAINSTCSNWDKYVAALDVDQDDSGI